LIEIWIKRVEHGPKLPMELASGFAPPALLHRT